MTETSALCPALRREGAAAYLFRQALVHKWRWLKALVAFEPCHGELASRSCASVAPTISRTSNTSLGLAPEAPKEARIGQCISRMSCVINIQHLGRQATHCFGTSTWQGHKPWAKDAHRTCTAPRPPREPCFRSCQQPQRGAHLPRASSCRGDHSPGRKDQSSAFSHSAVKCHRFDAATHGFYVLQLTAHV